MEVEIRVDRGLCIGSGQCVHLAPRTFDQDERALAFVVDPESTVDDHTVRAITGCPMQAISLQVDRTVVGADELRNWVSGLRSDDPLVEVIGALSESHHELREVSGQAPTDEDAIVGLTRAHLADEDEAYEAIAALVDPAVVAAFEAGHQQVLRALAVLEAPVTAGADLRDRQRAATGLAAR